MSNWGILGLGRMGFAFINAINELSGSRLISIGSKSKKTYKHFESFSYEEVINNKDIDSIYISTLNNSHIALINQCLAANKNILCEKPVSLTFKELNDFSKKMREVKIKFYEAIAYYSHPDTLAILNLIQNNEIGEIQDISCSFGFKARYKPSSRLFNKKLGGGAIFDLGCYPISFAMLFAKNPEKITILKKNLEYSPSGVDLEANATLICDDSFQCNMHVSLKNNLKNNCRINGSKGYINIANPWLPSKQSLIEISSNKHFYIKNVQSNLSVYANQINNISKVFSKEENQNINLFDINKSLINMNLIENWLKN